MSFCRLRGNVPLGLAGCKTTEIWKVPVVYWNNRAVLLVIDIHGYSKTKSNISILWAFPVHDCPPILINEYKFPVILAVVI